MSKITYTDKVAINIDPSVAAINKCQASDMNSIKNAINQNGSFTPLTINNNTGVFYCSLEGTLATNDIIKVNVPTTIGNTNWYVSVDNDTTNYAVLYEDGTNVKPIDVSDKNVELYFNGSNFVLIGSTVQNAYSTSTTVPYSANYTNSAFQMVGTLLYNNVSGTTGNVTLADSAANYSFIEIYYRNDFNDYASMKVCEPNGKQVAISTTTPPDITSTANRMYAKATRYTINGTSITVGASRDGAIRHEANAQITQTNDISVVKVIGYK